MKSGKTNVNINVKDIAILSLMTALTIVFSFVPVNFGPISLALMILPTLIIAQVGDFKMTLSLGIIMGVMNYIAWFTTKAASPIAPIFQNPLVCILPRILIGMVSYGIRVLFRKFFIKQKFEEIEGKRIVTNKKSIIVLDQISIILATALGVITNTLFVGIFTLIFFYNKSLPSGIVIDMPYIFAWFGLNFLIEIIAFSLITPAITVALRSAKLVPLPPYMHFQDISVADDIPDSENGIIEKKDGDSAVGSDNSKEN